MPRRIGVLLLAALLAAGLARVFAGPEPASGYHVGADQAAANLAAAMAARGLTVEPRSVRFMALGAPQWAIGQSFRAWFTARDSGQHSDVWMVELRLAPSKIPLWLGQPRRLTHTPDGDELLLAAGPHGWLVATGGTPPDHLLWHRADRLHHIRLSQPTTQLTARLEPAEARLQVGAQAVTIGPTRVEPSSAGVHLVATPAEPLEAIPLGPQSEAQPLLAWPPGAGWSATLVDAQGGALVMAAAMGGVALHAFSPTRLSFDWVAGVTAPGGAGARGQGRVVDRRRAVVAVLGAGAANAGRVARGRILQSPTLGAATLAVGSHGQLGLGVWDAEGLLPGWRGVHQRVRPLVLDGHVVTGAQGPVAALGISAAGVPVWARGDAAAVAAVLVRIGVPFAVVLGHAPASLAVFGAGLDGPAVRLPGVGTPPVDAWRGWAADDFLVVRRRAPMALGPAWRAVPRAAGVPWVAQGVFEGLDVVRLDGQFLQPALDPAGAAPGVVRVGAGVESIPGVDGLVQDDVAVRPLRLGAMTLWAAADGAVTLARWHEGAPRWAAQGLALVEEGQVAPGARGRRPGRAVGVGQDARGRWLIAASARGDRALLAAAMRAAGAQRALLLGHDQQPSTGLIRVDTGRTWLDPQRVPAAALPAGAPALVFTAQRGPGNAATVRTFESAP
jgi:hypothetical protein